MKDLEWIASYEARKLQGSTTWILTVELDQRASAPAGLPWCWQVRRIDNERTQETLGLGHTAAAVEARCKAIACYEAAMRLMEVSS